MFYFQEDSMKNSFVRKAAALALACMMSTTLLAGCGSTKLDGTKTVVTVGDEAVELGVVSFYAKYQQAMMQKYYGAMLGNNGMFDTSIAATSSNDGTTYGEQMRNTALEDIEKMVVIKQHAGEYDISLTEEEEADIETAAKAYISANTESVRDMIGASEDNVKELLRLQTIQSKMMDPMVKDVDTNVSQEEAQQSKVTYVAISEDASTDTTSDAASTAEDTSQAAMAKAEQVLSALKLESDIASADMNTIVQGIDSTLTATVGHYTTNNTTDGSVDSNIVAAVEGMTDGTLVDHVITGSDGKTLYVARFDAVDDAEYTETTRASIIRTRKQNEYDKLTGEWMDAATIKVDQAVLKTLKLSDQEPITLADPASSAASAAEAESTAS